jgi:glycolate oxidase iron-sulfur subunit
MQTVLAEAFRGTAIGEEASDILRSCVRCGFCTATCPTYQLLGDELDGPRGRIALISQVLSGAQPTVHTQLHLDRCLTCRACETTCPSGVRYGDLLEIGRGLVDARVPRSLRSRLQRAGLRALLTSRAFPWLFRLGQQLRFALPRRLRLLLAPPVDAVPAPVELPQATTRTVLLLAGCVQPTMAPGINAAATRLLARLGITTLEIGRVGCCGAVRQHLGDPQGALAEARRNIDAWWPAVEQGAEAIVSTASGCGTQLADYGRLLQYDAAYSARAARVTQLCCDIAALLAREIESRPGLLPRALSPVRIAFQSPCSLQHGLRLRGVVERMLVDAGATLVPVAESHLCCGSAGTYSLLQPEIAGQLSARKLAALNAAQPELILSANIGCMTHLRGGGKAAVPVRHWIEWLDDQPIASSQPRNA